MKIKQFLAGFLKKTIALTIISKPQKLNFTVKYSIFVGNS